MCRKLVAYFSATGTTANIAEKLADAIDADIFEIEPKQLYTGLDLNWKDSKSRSSLEMADGSSRPAIAHKCTHMDDYEFIYIGFPIWWYQVPMIINTFWESYNLNGKTIIPFATSGGSNMDKGNASLSESCIGAKLCEGNVLPSSISLQDLEDWANSVNQ